VKRLQHETFKYIWFAIGSEPVRSGSNVEVVEGDFLTAPTLLGALAGVERAFLPNSSQEHAEAQQIAFIDAARQNGVAL